MNSLPTQTACSVRRAVLTGHRAIDALEHVGTKVGLRARLAPGLLLSLSGPAWGAVYLGCTELQDFSSSP